MFKTEESPKDSFLQQTKAAREERAHEKCKEDAVVCIQKNVRGWLARARFAKKILLVCTWFLYTVHNLSCGRYKCFFVVVIFAEQNSMLSFPKSHPAKGLRS